MGLMENQTPQFLLIGQNQASEHFKKIILMSFLTPIPMVIMYPKRTLETYSNGSQKLIWIRIQKVFFKLKTNFSSLFNFVRQKYFTPIGSI